ncbi:ArsR/SmtB family transcription factor [Maledivibacter halophilus]|uniref:Transcriptional regulator, ArsR family n=1 Tax=Maledivibacter halophilus TaxID=36842 RepID=A0A1T5M5C6_9FIRM|nr:metalloregulator ArsR/SmtB family transcription factor [Maledivibacter halophilus]SKC83333.1 transcriptional regulator, ArsR family [Maledivibacter halophilus]
MSNIHFDLTSSFLKALAHPTRLKIIERLKDEDELCVCHIYEDLELEQSNVSQHLKILKDNNILTSRKDGIKVMYSIKHKEVLEIINLVKKALYSQLKEEQEYFQI